MKSYSFIDLFAGCGGLSLGLTLAGLKGRFVVERDPMAFDTLQTNLLQPTGLVGRFKWPAWLEKRPWDIAELLSSHATDIRGLRGSIDVLAGGPPCQGFSFAGRRQEDDPRNLMFEKYVQFVAEVRPSALILENVPGMRVAHGARNVIKLRNKAGAVPSKTSFYDRLAQSLGRLGYDVEAVLLDASKFGVPQKRSRLIVVGLRRELARELDGGIGRVIPLLEEARREQLKEFGLRQGVTASDAISDLEIRGKHLIDCTDTWSPAGFKELAYQQPKTRFQRLMHRDASEMDSMRLARHRPDIQDRFSRILAECRKGVRMDDKMRDAYGLRKHRIYPMSASDPAPTITTLPDDVLHYSEPRILTVRESARLQTFPDWFKFVGKYTTGGDRRGKECPRYTQVGNAVPPFLARAIGLAVGQMLDEARSGRSEHVKRSVRERVAATA